MKTSQAGIDLIKSFEGLRLTAYADPVGVWTIGYGHTAGVKEGDQISQSQAEDLLRADLEEFEEGVRDAVQVSLTQQQFDALVSLAFNVGLGAFRRSTLRRRLNAGDYEGAAQEFARWNMAGGRVLHGLTKRRAAERDMFLSGTTPKEDKPMAPFIAAALPAVVEAVPALIRMFGKGEVTERNAKAAEMVVGVAKEALGVSPAR